MCMLTKSRYSLSPSPSSQSRECISVHRQHVDPQSVMTLNCVFHCECLIFGVLSILGSSIVKLLTAQGTKKSSVLGMFQ